MNLNKDEFYAQLKAIIAVEAADVWNDLNGPDGLMEYHIEYLYLNKFSLGDAIRYTKLMSQNLDEDIAIIKMSKLDLKYKAANKI